MKSGYVAVIGKANAGKSTLINALVGEKISIVSKKPQTTRDRILGVKNGDDYQIVFIDTPGIYKANSMLNSYMQRITEDTPDGADVILFLLDVHNGITEEDKSLIKKFSGVGLPFVLGLTKIDITDENFLIARIKEFSDANFPIIPVSGRKGKNLKDLVKTLTNLLPEGDKIFGDDVISDKSVKFMIKEILREKILENFDKEIPHGVAVYLREFEKRKDGVYQIMLDIVCEKQNHKGILIGKGGSALKSVNLSARLEMERFLEGKVFLQTFVKVKEDWRNSASDLKEMGYVNEE